VTGARIALASTLALGVVATAGEAMAVEKLGYETIEENGPFELRRLAPHVVAETFVDGDFEDVGNEGFRRLVAYIGGENRQQDEISMTAPVAQAPATRIAMTAPVGQERSGDRYRITFVMPSQYTLESLPEPTDERITLRPEPARTVAVVRYSGFWSRSRYEDHERKLQAWVERRGLEPLGEPVWARYDPPFMPWFLRRNEILIEVSEPPRPDTGSTP
jgi:hypothetical protein